MMQTISGLIKDIRVNVNRNLLFYILILIFAIFKILQLLRFHSIVWDEAVYIGMAKSIYSLGEIGLWETIRPIGFPMIIGLPWKLGLNIISFSELQVIFFSIGCIALTYCISKKLFGMHVALLSSLLLMATPVYFFHS